MIHLGSIGLIDSSIAKKTLNYYFSIYVHVYNNWEGSKIVKVRLDK